MFLLKKLSYMAFLTVDNNQIIQGPLHHWCIGPSSQWCIGPFVKFFFFYPHNNLISIDMYKIFYQLFVEQTTTKIQHR